MWLFRRSSQKFSVHSAQQANEGFPIEVRSNRPFALLLREITDLLKKLHGLPNGRACFGDPTQNLVDRLPSLKPIAYLVGDDFSSIGEHRHGSSSVAWASDGSPEP